MPPTALKSLVEFSEQMATDGEDLKLYLETSRTSFAFRAAVVTRILLKTSVFPNSYPFAIHNHHTHKPTEISVLYPNLPSLFTWSYYFRNSEFRMATIIGKKISKVVVYEKLVLRDSTLRAFSATLRCTQSATLPAFTKSCAGSCGPPSTPECVQLAVLDMATQAV